MRTRRNEVSEGKPRTRRRVLALGGLGAGLALAGCSAPSGPPTSSPEEATVTVRMENRDDQPREFEVIVNQGESLSDSFSGVLPANQEEGVEMVATFRATDEQHDFTIRTAEGQRGRTWDPRECGDFFVNGYVENGEPGFDTQCRSG